jgi:diguanylate cyclase (GGDEF)-like protein/PAS domain S-box-containing protein
MTSPRFEEPPAIARDRERTLGVVLPLAVLVCLSGALVIVNGPQADAFDPLMFEAAGLALFVAWIAFRQRWLSYRVALATTIVVGGALPMLHVGSLFAGPTYHDPQVSLLNVTYAFFPVYLTLLASLLTYPASLRAGVWAWLAFAGSTTLFTIPYWHETPLREGLLGTLMLLWVGFPVYLVLVTGTARRYARMLYVYAMQAGAAEQANAEAERSALKFRSIFNQAAVGIALLDARGQWLSVNQRVCEITGYSASELMRTDFQSLTHPADLAADVTLADKVLRHEIDTYSIEKRYLHKDGSIVWVNLSVSRIDGVTPDEDCFVSVIEDVSKRKGAEADLASANDELARLVTERTMALQQSSERWRERNKTVSIVNELIAFLLSARDEAEACRIASSYMPQILGGTAGVLRLTVDGDTFTPAGSWGDVGVAAVIAKPDCWAARRGLSHHARAGQPGLRCAHYHDVDARSPCACEPMIVDGRIIGVLSVKWPEGAEQALEADAVLVSTVAEQLALALSNIRLRAELQALAVRDPLTGLHNRRQLNEHLPRTIAAARRSGTMVSVLLADVDHFKQFNDRFGHDAGDRVLKAVAGAMGRTLRAGDLAFRYGGEEFVAVLSDCGPDDALLWAERLRAAIADASMAADPEGRMPAITCSVGVASFPADGASTDQLLKAADRALYEAKGAGRNCVRLRRAA